MSISPLSRSGKFARVIGPQAAGTGTTNGSSVNMAGYDSVTFVLSVDTIASTGTVTLKAQQSADDSSFADLEGTAIAFADDDDDKLAVLEVNRPGDQYVRPVVVRATANGTLDCCIAVQTKANTEPVTQSATVVGAEYHHSPSEGTA